MKHSEKIQKAIDETYHISLIHSHDRLLLSTLVTLDSDLSRAIYLADVSRYRWDYPVYISNMYRELKQIDTTKRGELSKLLYKLEAIAQQSV